MSASDATSEQFCKDLLYTEIDAPSLEQLFAKMFKEGAALDTPLEMINNKALKELKNNVEALASLQDASLEKALFAAKTSAFETKKWIELLIASYKKRYPSTRLSAEILTKIEEAFSFIDLCVAKIDSFLPQVKEIRRKRLTTNFSHSIESIQKEMDQILFAHFETQKRIPLLHYHLSNQVYQKIVDRLEAIKGFLIPNRDKWEDEVLQSAKNLYVYSPKEFPYPILYTKEGLIYVVQEVLEHFVGAGTTRFVSRTFEMQTGTVWALIRPKTKDINFSSDRDKAIFRQVNFNNSWREIQFLRKLKGAQGIIQLKEGMVFSINNELSLFEICELFDSQSLNDVMRQMKHSSPPSEMTQEEKIDVARDLLNGLKAIHQKGIIHRDIKIDNVLVALGTSSKKTEARIIDFNAAVYETEEEHKMYPTSANYCPPEHAKTVLETRWQITDKLIPLTTKKIDVWALGCVFYLLFLAEEFPWHYPEGLHDPQKELLPEDFYPYILEKILALKGDWIAPALRGNPFYPLIKNMLALDPEKRYTAEQALMHFERIASPLAPS